MYAQTACVYVGSDMNQELEDLMLEYLLRKKLDKSVYKKLNLTAPVSKKRKRRYITRHKWNQQDYQKVAFLFNQGLSAGQIAKEMNLRTAQIDGAIECMQGKRINTSAPKLLVQS
jgi:hypothetical protein